IRRGCCRDQGIAGSTDDRHAMGGREISVNRPAEHDNAVRRATRSIPWRKALLQGIKQPVSERRETAYRQQHDGGQHQLAAKRCPSRGQQDGADETDNDQEIRRQQHDAERFGKHKKHGRPRGSSGTASYATAVPTRSPPLMTHHHLHSSPETCHWGFFEAKLKPALTIASGDEVTIDTISGGPDVVPDRSKFHVPPELADVHAQNERMVPGHILTGPVAVDGAEAGDVLEVDILDVQLRQDWGYNLIRPLAGTLPDDFHETRILNLSLDRERMVGRLPWGLDLPLKPFFGVMGVAPPPAWGRITSLIPRAVGGNLDNKELIPGAKL